MEPAAADTPEPVIICVDCGSDAHLLWRPGPDNTVEPGDIVPYRCEDCGARWDVVFDVDTW